MVRRPQLPQRLVLRLHFFRTARNRVLQCLPSIRETELPPRVLSGALDPYKGRHQQYPR